MSYLLDTGFAVALLNRRDVRHAEVAGAAANSRADSFPRAGNH